MGFIEALDQIKHVGPETVQSVLELYTPLVDCVKVDIPDLEKEIFSDKLRAMLFVLVGKLGENVMQGVSWDVGQASETSLTNIKQAATKLEAEQGSGSLRIEVESLFEEAYDEPLSQVDYKQDDEILEIALAVDRATEGMIIGNVPAADKTSGKMVLKDQEGYVRAYRLLHTLYLKHDDPAAEQDVIDIIHELAGEGQVFEFKDYINDLVSFRGIEVVNEVDPMSLVTREERLAYIYSTYQEYERRLFKFVRNKSDNDQDAEDIVAETFLKAINSLAWNSSFSGWLFRIANNQRIDFYRRLRKETVLVDFEFEDADDSEKVMHFLVDERAVSEFSEVERQDLLDRIKSFIRSESLTETERAVIELWIYGNFTLEETAEALEKTIGAIKSFRARIRTKLIDRFNPKLTQ